jgi:hypothetical protein
MSMSPPPKSKKKSRRETERERKNTERDMERLILAISSGKNVVNVIESYFSSSSVKDFVVRMIFE